MTSTDQPHNRSQYQRGCRCATCCNANRVYARNRKRAKSGLTVVPAAAPTPAPSGAGLGAVAAAVQLEIDATGSGAARPALAAIALALGRLLDDDSARPHFPSAAHRLTEILAQLHKGNGKRGRLAAVRDMTGRRGDC